MRHHQYNPRFTFVKEPEEFDRNTDRALLQYCLGATMYMPGTKDFLKEILENKYPGLTSIVMCFEDACPENDVEKAEKNVLNLLEYLSEKVAAGELDNSDIPLIIVRVRNNDQFNHFSEKLQPKHLEMLTAINFPKFNSCNGDDYFSKLQEINEKYGKKLYGMPIIEDRLVAFSESRIDELVKIKGILDRYKELVLNVRVGCTDFSSCFGVRRDVDYTIYDISTVRDILADILNLFSRDNEYTVSGPVWEYFKINRSMKFQQLPKIDLQQSLLRRTPLINDEIDGLMRELILDKANGFIGKTIIHPSHIQYVNGMYAVTKDEYEDAVQILSKDGGVQKSVSSNRMNENKPHHSWAEKIVMRSRAYGVIENELSYLELFGQNMKGH
ncbi:MAG: HpcH/HpaI aldolase/citrate lyase family protein [Lachnospiraceae bacterium]|nr:HpcH/HpaI aldolase/citrate lyase family protein [Lachnospiraceae bacterium]